MKYLSFFLCFFWLASAQAAPYPVTCANDGSHALTFPSGGNEYVCAAVSGGGGGTVTLGTSASATNPQRSGQAGTGLFSAVTNTVSIGAAGSAVVDFNAVGATFDGTGAVTLPAGTTAQRPTGANGMIRYNSSLSTIEGYLNGAWAMISNNYADLETYGAKCDGSTDDTTAFQNATAANSTVYVDGSASGCVINSAVLQQTNVTLIGNFLSTLGYSSNISGESQLIAKASATYILNLTSGLAVNAYGIDFNGNNTAECISSSTGNVKAWWDTFRNCANNAIGDSSTTTNIEAAHNLFYNNGASANGDISNPVDGRIMDNDFASIQGYAVYLPSGANDNIITNNKIEYSISFGILCYQASHNLIANNIFDHNAYGAFSFNGCSNFLFDGNVVRRNAGASGTYGQNATLYSAGGSYNYTISNTVTDLDPTVNAQYFMLNNGVDYNANIHDNDMTAVTIGTIYDNATQVDRVKHNNLGDTTPNASGSFNVTGELTTTQLATPTTPTITHAGTSGSSTWTYVIVGYSATGATTPASTAGSTTSGNATLTISNYNIITFVPITGAAYYKIFRTVAATSPTTLGVIATVFPTSGSLVFHDTGVAGDTTTAPTVNTTGFINSAYAASAYQIGGTPVLFEPDADTTSIAVGAAAFASATTTSLYSVAVGVDALNANTTGAENTAVGYYAGKLITTGSGNSAFGYEALQADTTGASNSAFGYQALNANTTATQNVAIGNQAQRGTTSGGSNTSVGYQAMYSNTTGANNTAIGDQALYTNTTGTNNTALGVALYTLNGGGYNTAVGFQSMNNATTGANNTALGYQSLEAVTTGTANIAIGYEAENAVLTTGTDNIYIGATTAASGAAVTKEYVFGYGLTGGGSNTINIGGVITSTGDGTPSTSTVTIPGNLTVTGTCTGCGGGGGTITLGTSAAATNPQRSSEVETGFTSLNPGEIDAFLNNSGTGELSLFLSNSTNGNLSLGYESLYAVTTGTQNTTIGYQAGSKITNGSSNVVIGSKVGTNNLTNGSYNILIGTNQSVDTATSSTQGATLISGNVNYASNPRAGTGDTFVGFGTGNASGDGGDNTGVGSYVLSNCNGCGQNVAVGFNTLNQLTNGSQNLVFGYYSGKSITTGSRNIGVGNSTLYNLVTGARNTGIGDDALVATTNSNNTGIGAGAGGSIVGGYNNTAIGYAVGSTVLTGGTDNILIGTENTTDTAGGNDSHTIAIGGAGLGSNTTEIGLSGTTTATTLYGTLSLPNLGSSTAAQTGTVCYGSAGLITYDPALGCLTSLAENKKTIKQLSPRVALDEVMALKPSTYFYNNKAIIDRQEQIGLIAQQAEKVDPRLVAYDEKGKLRGVRYNHLGPLAIAAIQELNAKVEMLKSGHMECVSYAWGFYKTCHQTQ